MSDTLRATGAAPGRDIPAWPRPQPGDRSLPASVPSRQPQAETRKHTRVFPGTAAAMACVAVDSPGCPPVAPSKVTGTGHAVSTL